MSTPNPHNSPPSIYPTPDEVRGMIVTALDHAHDLSGDPVIDEGRRHSRHAYDARCHVCQRDTRKIADAALSAVGPFIAELLLNTAANLTNQSSGATRAAFESEVSAANKALLDQTKALRVEIDTFDEILHEIGKALEPKPGTTLVEAARARRAEADRLRDEHQVMRFRIDAVELVRQTLINHQRDLYEALGWDADIDPDDVIDKAAELHDEVEQLRAEVARLRADRDA